MFTALEICVLTLATYPYAIKNQRKARNAPSRGHFVPKPLVGGFGCLEQAAQVKKYFRF